MNNNFFSLHANCIPVKGAARSGICDIQKGHFETIPNSMFEIIEECKNKPFQIVLKSYEIEDQKIIEGYIKWMLDKDFGFWCSEEEKKYFPALSERFEMPYHITNIIIDIDSSSQFNITNIVNQVKELGIPYVQIRSYSMRSLVFFLEICNELSRSRVKGIEIITPYYEDLKSIRFDEICKDHLRISSITFWGSPEQKISEEIGGLTKIFYVKEEIKSANCCGLVSPSFFSINKDLFFESKNFNSCLNKKIAIDTNGQIKNCPSMKKEFGNINSTALASVIQNEKFKSLWEIRKDEIAICQNCEFRYICTDCRAYLENPDDLHSKPLKCGYDPMTAKWESWATNPIKQQAIKHYGLEEIKSNS